MIFKKIWHKYLMGKSTPWAHVSYVQGQLAVADFNDAFVKDLREKLGEVAVEKTDRQVVDLFFEREKIEKEDPRLDVLHSGIDKDGRVMMKLDWNSSFIKMLADNGISGETEEEAIQKYLSALTQQVSDEMGPVISNEMVDIAFREEGLEAELIRELEEAAKNAKKVRKPRQRKQKPVSK